MWVQICLNETLILCCKSPAASLLSLQRRRSRVLVAFMITFYKAASLCGMMPTLHSLIETSSTLWELLRRSLGLLSHPYRTLCSSCLICKAFRIAGIRTHPSCSLIRVLPLGPGEAATTALFIGQYIPSLSLPGTSALMSKMQDASRNTTTCEWFWFFHVSVGVHVWMLTAHTDYALTVICSVYSNIITAETFVCQEWRLCVQVCGREWAVLSVQQLRPADLCCLKRWWPKTTQIREIVNEDVWFRWISLI